jgi:hypothetical protein
MKASTKEVSPPLTREQIGPFFLLGLDKDAKPSEVETHWAQRVVWARKNEPGAQLGDVNWAREVLNDPERRLAAEASTFNADTQDRALALLAERYALAISGKPAWPVLDHEKPLADYVPPMDIPDPDAVLQAINLPEMPPDSHLVESLLKKLALERLDPWDINLSRSDGVQPHE